MQRTRSPSSQASQEMLLDSLGNSFSSMSSSKVPHERKKYDNYYPAHDGSACTHTSSLTLRSQDGLKGPPPYESYEQSTNTASIFCVDPRVISDATIGLSDGLTVPFALTAGLAALGSSRVVVFGGLAELIAGSISMGLGGYLGANAESEAYANLVSSTRTLVQRYPDHALEVLRDSLAPLGIDTTELEALLRPQHTTILNETRMTQLLLRYAHSQPTGPSSSRAFYSGLTIALSYFSGGFVPLLPYLFVSQVGRAFWYSVALMVVSLAMFGAGKSLLLMGESHVKDLELDKEDLVVSRARRARLRETRWRHTLFACLRGALQMILLGGIAACAAMGLVYVFDGGHGVD